MATSALQLPSITAAYSNGTLQAREGALFKPSADINGKVSFWQGDITSLDVDGIRQSRSKPARSGTGFLMHVNFQKTLQTLLFAGEEALMAIHRAAGPDLLKACRKLGGCKTGNTKITEGFDLHARYVLHTVGPIYDDDEAEICHEELEGCYQTTLDLAKEHGLKTVALCGVSTGVYGFPLREATEIALRTTRTFLEENHEQFERIVFCNFGNRDVRMYAELAPLYFPPSDEAAEPAADTLGSDSDGVADSEKEDSPQPAKREDVAS